MPLLPPWGSMRSWTSISTTMISACSEKLLTDRKEDYSHYVIIPHFLEGEEHAPEIINSIPRDKLVLLDKKIPGITGEFAGRL